MIGSGTVPVPGPMYAIVPPRPAFTLARRFCCAFSNSPFNQPVSYTLVEFQFSSVHAPYVRLPWYRTSNTVSLVTARWKLTFQESVHGTWMSGLKFHEPVPQLVQYADAPVPVIVFTDSGNCGLGLNAGAPSRSF